MTLNGLARLIQLADARKVARLPLACLALLAVASCVSEGPLPRLNTGELVKAADDGDLERIRILLKDGTLPDDEDEKGRTALLVAVGSNRMDIAKLLLDSGASVSGTKKLPTSPLHVAVAQGNVEMARLLLASGADPNAQGETITPMMLGASQAKLELVELLLEGGGNPTQTDGNGASSFHIAASRGEPRVLQALIVGRNAVEVDIANSRGLTPLHTALLLQREENAILLIEHGCSLKTKTQAGQTALFFAAGSASTKAVQLILARDKSLATARDITGRTPLHAAAGTSSAEIVQLLLDAGVDLESSDKSGRTALHDAALFGSADVVKLLLSRGSDPKRRDKDGQTPFADARNDDIKMEFIRSGR